MFDLGIHSVYQSLTLEIFIGQKAANLKNNGNEFVHLLGMGPD
jgi:hypothetical protein